MARKPLLRRRVNNALAWGQRLDRRFGINPARNRPRDYLRTLTMLGTLYFVVGGIFAVVAETNHWLVAKTFAGIACAGLFSLVAAAVLRWARYRNSR